MLTAIAALAVLSPQGLDVKNLPVGSAPTPVEAAHFPTRLHAFVWRNWTLVPCDRMAKVVGAEPDQIRRIGRAMGLPAPPRIGPEIQARGYLTIIRRNWHLLPYEQLLALLEWTPEQMAFTLREDDFLYIKLGNHKPKCDALRYSEPNAPVLRREAEIARIVRQRFGDRAGLSREPLFSFVKKLSETPPAARRESERPVAMSPRFCYSYFALYGDPLLEPLADPFPEGFLARINRAGADGVWMQAVLYKLAPFPWQPELSSRYEERLSNLKALVARAKRQGVGIWLYLNEPRAMPLSFFTKHPELKGVTEGDYATICTSVPAVQQYVRSSIASIARAVPDLAGFFTITASENLTNCWSHHRGGECPRCSKRPAAEVIAEVNGLIQAGIHDAGSKAKLHAWDWGWQDAWAADAIRRLPPEVALQSVSEWSLPIERGGIKNTVGEYSISSIGPGPRASRHWEEARKQGHRIIAKIQANNTWELSTVPYIPAVENVAQHALNLQQSKVDGLMLGWTLGGYPSPNLEAVMEAGRGASTVDEVLSAVATRRVGKGLAPVLVQAWKRFSAAFREFPYDGAVVYNAPTQLGPANPLWEKPTGYAATMVGFPYDQIDGWRGPYPAEVFFQQFEKMADGFEAGIAAARKTTGGGSKNRVLEEELKLAEACAIHFRSVANQCRYILSRRQPARDRAEIQKALEAEIVLAERLYRLQVDDSRLGFEASNQYAYIPIDLIEKVLNCLDLADRFRE